MRLSDIRRGTQLFAVKTSIAHEKGVAEMIEHKIEMKKKRGEQVPDIKSIVVIDQLRGYVFIEAIHQRDVLIATSEIHHVKGSIGQVQLNELDNFLKPESIVESLEIGDKVEVVKGIFAGEHGYVSKIDESKDEVTLTLIGSSNQIPITFPADDLKIIEKGAMSAMIAGEATVVGHGIKEYSFDSGSSAGNDAGTETTTPGSSDTGIPVDEMADDAGEDVPEVISFGKTRYKLVGERFSLNVDEDEDELEDEYFEDFDSEFEDFDDFGELDELESEGDSEDEEEDDDFL